MSSSASDPDPQLTPTSTAPPSLADVDDSHSLPSPDAATAAAPPRPIAGASLREETKPSTTTPPPLPPPPVDTPSEPITDNVNSTHSQPPPEPPTDSPDYRALFDRILSFLSTATPETLAGIGLGAALVLYGIFGGLGLLVIGVIGGAVGQAHLGVRSRPASGVPGLKEVLESLQRRIEAGEDDEKGVVLGERSFSKEPDWTGVPPETRKALEDLVEAGVRNYVKWWYTPILPNDTNFPNACRNQLANTLLAMYWHLSHKRAADTFLLFLVSVSNTFIVLLRELAAAQESSIATYLEESPNSALSQMLDSTQQQRRLKLAAEDIVARFFGEDVKRCEPVRTFAVEMISGVALKMTVEKCADMEWIEGMVVWMLQEETQPEIFREIDIGEATKAAEAEKEGKMAPQPEPAKEYVPDRRASQIEEERRAVEEAESMNRILQQQSEVSKRQTLPAAPTSAPSLPPPETKRNTFTSFDQLPTAPPTESLPSLLHGATITLDDLSTTSSSALTRPLRSKPTTAAYLLQIEPASSLTPGWLVTRKYTDFESLHEVLRRISTVSGLTSFSNTHADLPTWRNETPNSLREKLEHYLNNALDEKELAECEGMKRFLDKETGVANVQRQSGTFAGLGKGIFPGGGQAFAKMGQNTLNALSKAPQGVAEGGKGLFGGMKKAFQVSGASLRDDNFLTNNTTSTPSGRSSPSRMSLSFSRDNRSDSIGSLFSLNRVDELERKRDTAEIGDPFSDNQHAGIGSQRPRAPSRTPSMLSTRTRENTIQVELPSDDGSSEMSRVISLPPPPSDIPDDFLLDSTHPPTSQPHNSISTTSSLPPAPTTKPAPQHPHPPKAASKQPLTSEETAFTLEIVFALLTELYTLSSAWTLRLAVLNLAKSILLRPGNASLDSIRDTIQNTLLDSMTTDEAVAGLVRKVREAVFPTKEEQAAWEVGDKKNARVDADEARGLWVRKGVPEALRGVMGAATTEEALGRVWDAVEVGGVRRGVVGGLVVEVVRGVCS